MNQDLALDDLMAAIEEVPEDRGNPLIIQIVVKGDFLMHKPGMRVETADVETPALPMPIDEEKLGSYFKASFRGMGSNSHNDFSTLLKELSTDFTESEFCSIAYLIYNSTVMNNRRPATFKQWYKTFSELTGCPFNERRKPSRNLPTERVKRLILPMLPQRETPKK